jgi:hypothetical protein
MNKRVFTMLLLTGCTLAAASCVSPETTRSRGQGAGADVGNRASRVEVHAGSDPFWKTPNRIGQHRLTSPPLDPARQARAFERP